MKSFTCELQDLYPSNDFWTEVTVYYECEEICGPIEDEFGREWALKELSIFDLNLINKHLVQNIAADREEKRIWGDFGEVWQ